MNLTDFATPFYGNGYFGAYPSPECIDLLVEQQFDYLVNLTVFQEKNLNAYETPPIPVLYYPIKDNNVPHNWENFSYLVVWLCKLLGEGKRIFIHCKGGHGRSCLLVTCIIYYLSDHMNAREAIEHTVHIHNQRTDMSIRWKGIKSPFSKSQYIFLYKFLNPICILKSYNTGYQAGFSGSSLFEIETKDGKFSNLDAAFQALRGSVDNEFVTMLELTWNKFDRYPELQQNLLITGIRKIYDFSRYAFKGNLIGKCLMSVREQYLINCFQTKLDLTFHHSIDELHITPLLHLTSESTDPSEPTILNEFE
jgi:hypothetical protein